VNIESCREKAIPEIFDNEVHWLESELQDVDLGDKRLDWRLRDTGKKLASNPSEPINQACDDWADTKASYRLFDNEKTDGGKVLSSHYTQTWGRAQLHARVLAIQDTTFLDYTHHPDKEGMGPIGTEKQNLQGMVMHSTLLTTCTGLPLGLVAQDIWVRPEEAKRLTRTEKRKLPIEEKESFKWLQALTSTLGSLPKSLQDALQVITVGDSESDIFELFNHAGKLDADLLIRACQDRAVCEPYIGRLWYASEHQPVAGQLEVQVTARNQEPARKAIVTVRYTKVTVKPPQHLQSKMDRFPVYAVLVKEENPPNGVKDPLCWLLLTTVPVLSFEDATERIQWYRSRWQIEVYHKVLKSGCNVEKCQLATATRLRPYLALFAIIAWRIFWMTHIARHQPDSPCTLVLDEHEWNALYTYHNRTDSIPQTIPSVHDVISWIAQLGGFLNRRADGPPGVTYIWRGWQRLNDIVRTYLIFQPNILVGNG